ncbi:hypothetical protein FB639_000940, partial [Coemansia asiatica]
MYGNDQFYRRHSVDIGVSIGDKQSHLSPPRHLRFSHQSSHIAQYQQQQQQQPPQPASYGSSSDPRAYVTCAVNPGGSGPQPPPSHSKPWVSYSGGGQASLSSPQRQPQQQQQQQQQVAALRSRHGSQLGSGGPVGGHSSAQLQQLEKGAP